MKSWGNANEFENSTRTEGSRMQPWRHHTSKIGADQERGPVNIANRKSQIANGNWLPDMDLNHDKQIQSLLCYRYTIGQAGAATNLEFSRQESSC